MLEDILQLRQSHDFKEKFFKEQTLFGTAQYQKPEEKMLSIYQDYLQSPFQNFKKESTDESSQLPSFIQMPNKQKKKRVRKYTSNNPNNKKGHWTHEQSLKYHYFLQLHATQFIDCERRKTEKVFKLMAEFVETREAHQCRSRHQKIQKKWGSFSKILLNLRLQNFNKTDSKDLTKQFQRIGFQYRQILDPSDLQNEGELYRKILARNFCQNGQNDEKITEEDNDLQPQEDNFMCDNNVNRMCLMMSQCYQDQLAI